jgi:hypothetical protein
MKVSEKGHIYQPQIRTPEGEPKGYGADIVFVNKQPGQGHEGTTTQEIIRILLDRTRHCANCMPHPNNERIVHHLRMALVLHEARALERKTEKGEIEPEYLGTGGDGHFKTLIDEFQPKDYFENAPKAAVLKGIEEACGKDALKPLENKSKPEIAAFAAKHLPIKGWLPPELRTVHYGEPKKRQTSTQGSKI